MYIIDENKMKKTIELKHFVLKTTNIKLIYQPNQARRNKLT